MPKYNNKSKRNQAHQPTSDGFGSDDDTSCDNESVFSYSSEAPQQGGGGGSQEDELESIEKYEDKLIQAMDHATEKAVQTRTKALESMCEILMQRYMPDFVDERKITIMDLAEKGIKRGKGKEQALSARLAALLIVQVGNDEEIIKQLSPILLSTALDPAVDIDARAKCCLTLGLLNYLGNDDLGEILSLMRSFEQIFCGSYLKGDNSPSSAGAAAASLHSAALSAWGLLMIRLPSSDIARITDTQTTLPSVKALMGLLNSAHLDVRMTAGEVFALLVEAGREHDEEFLEEHLSDLIETTRTLSKDSQKFRAKRDRKTQRATFRDVLHYIEDGVSPEILVRFGRESLMLDSWETHRQYTSFCSVMGPGLNRHLVENEFVRDILGLGPRLTEATMPKSMSKADKKFMNADAFKARTKIRSKNRDKRSAVIT